MAVNTLTGHFSTGSYGNDNTRSCLGFAGQGSGGAKQIWVDADWTVQIDDSYNLTLTLSNLKIGQTDTLDSDYQFYFAVVPGEQTMPNSIPSNARASKSYSIDLGGIGANRISWTRNLANFGPFNIGKADQYIYNDQGDLEIFIGGCSTYHVDDPVYPKSMPIYLSSGDVNNPFVSYTDYYPWGRYLSGVWKSHNRTGGSLKRYSGGKWVDVKNATIAGRTDHGFTRHSNAWVKSPITGTQG